MKQIKIFIITCCVCLIFSKGYCQLVIGGPPNVCLTANNQYTYTAYKSGSSSTESGSGHVWTLPSNAVLIGGGDGQNFVTLRFTAVATAQNLSVTSTEGSGTLSISAFDLPSGTGVISGPSLVTAGQTGVKYSLSGVSPVSTFGWSVPVGATITAGTNTSTITVSFPSNFGSGNISVMPVNYSCWNSAVSLQVASGPTPAAPGAITGSAQVTTGSSSYTYSVAAVTNATSYQWSVPAGATIVSGAGTNSVSVNFSTSFKGGSLTVKGTNGFVEGPLSPAYYVTPAGYPAQAGVIAGSDSQCIEYTDLVSTYIVPPIAGATSYSWSVTDGATISGTSTSNTVDIKFSATVSGSVTISVKGVNNNGTGGSSSKTITINKPVANAGGARIQPSVDLATGIMSTSIPLFSISSGDVLVPIALSYTANGVRVTDDDGAVGQNWNLSVLDYRISREVRSLPDDYLASGTDVRKGWLINNSVATTIKDFIPATDNDASTCNDEVANYNTLQAFTYNTDTEPDIFYVNAPGLSFQFYFDETRTPRVLPYEDVVIKPNTVDGPITSFTVEDPSGFSYTFSEMETWTQSIQAPSQYYFVRQTNLCKTPITYTTSWRLTSITSAVYGTVSFTYKTVNVNDPSLMHRASGGAPYQYNYAVSLKDGNSDIVQTLLYNRKSVIKILQKVSSSDMEAVFTSAAKSSTTPLERVSAINLYDKRDGTSRLTRSFSFTYGFSGSDRRALLSRVSASAGCQSVNYTMEYYSGVLPTYDNISNIDEWGFYKGADNVAIGTLKKLTYPYKGYDVFFYEPHSYWNNGSDYPAGGLRLKKMISYDGVSPDNDRIQEYQYLRASGTTPYPGTSSGVLQYRAQHAFSVAALHNGICYTSLNSKKFDLTSSLELSTYGPFRGSTVAYERVIAKERNGGRSEYEFNVQGILDSNDLTVANGHNLTRNQYEVNPNGGNSEWQASKVFVARPAPGTSACYELAQVGQGAGQYPFPPDPNFDFAKAQLKRVTNYREDNVLEREVVYTYQRIYRNGSSIRKIYGLALEELPTFRGSFCASAKMFVFSRYEIFTDVKTALTSQTETLYNSADKSKNIVTRTDYWFESPNHSAVTRIESTNSDGSIARKKISYSKDYAVTALPNGSMAFALSALNKSSRILPVETVTSVIAAGTEKAIGADLATYQTLNGKIFPYQQYSFTSTDGTTAFAPSSVSGGSTFQFDQANYTLQGTVLNADSYGNVIETVGKDRSSNGVAFGYNGTIPIIQVNNAGIYEIKYTDFETASSTVNPTVGWSNPVYVTGRNNSKGVLMPAGSQNTNVLVHQLTYNYIRPRDYVVSAWIKAATAGTITIMTTGPGLSGQTFTFPFTASNDYRYYQFRLPVGSMGSTGAMLVLLVWSNTAINIDDVAAYPDQSGFVASTYQIPNGKKSDTDARGVSQYYDYDLWGRLKALYDQDKNVLRKMDYQVKP
jgi:hypothetical protein